MRPRSEDGPVSLPPRLVPRLLRWFARHRRPLPWRRDRDPYHVWVAEVLLQQTRVAQAIPYYERFLSEFPDLETLAESPVERVLKVWEGAGYYARARHLHEAARTLWRERTGRFPTTVHDLEELPGVGPYIARAVAAIAFDVPAVPLDANGLRVAARWTLERRDVRSPKVRARLERTLTAALGNRPAGPFAEAVMELGETICVSIGPRCEVCPVAPHCRARAELPDPGILPSKHRRRRRPHVRAAVVVLSDGAGRWWVQRRPPHGLLGGLWEFPGGKIEPGENPEVAARRELEEETGARIRGPLAALGTVRHGYSHFTVELHVFRARGARSRLRPGPDRKWVTETELRRLPLPRATEKVVQRLRSAGPGRASPGSGSHRGRTGASRHRAARRKVGRVRARETAP